jgi:hypothetical protein
MACADITTLEINRKRSVFILKFLDHILEKSMERWVKGHGKGTIAMFWGSPAEPHQNIATVVICISMSFHQLSHAFSRMRSRKFTIKMLLFLSI